MPRKNEQLEEIISLDYFLPREEMPTWKEENDIISNLQFFRLFPDEAASVKFYEDYRWRNGLFCPRCGGDNAYRPTGRPSMSHRCRDCNRYFSVRIATPVENSNLGIQAWLYSIHLLLTDRKGESALKMMKSIGVSYDTAWFLFQRIRRMMKLKAIPMLEGIIQVDISFLGGKFKNIHTKRKEQYADWTGNKIPVGGLRDQDGKVILKQLPDTRPETILSFVLEHVRPGSEVWSDGEEALKALPDYGIRHRSVSHRAKQYVADDGTTTNAIEGVWSILKRTYMGTHHYISAKHAQAYLDELAFRHNGGYGNGPRSIGAVLDMAEGEAFPWEELTGKKRHS